jgi:hypothetical protein
MGEDYPGHATIKLATEGRTIASDSESGWYVMTIDDVIEYTIWLAAAVAAVGFCLVVFGAL